MLLETEAVDKTTDGFLEACHDRLLDAQLPDLNNVHHAAKTPQGTSALLSHTGTQIEDRIRDGVL